MPCRQHFRLALLAALGLCALLLYSWSPFAPLTPRVQAHAVVIGSDPIDGSTVTTAPRVMRIYFNGTISPASRAQVIDASGRVVNAGPSVIPAGNPRELDTPLLPPSQLAQGSYLVRWTALSSDDGHTTQGAIGFNIGHSSTGLPGQVILGPS